MHTNQPTALIILDGFGYSEHKKYNAIAHAHIPHLSQWLALYPHTLLKASGTAVGLMQGYIGNSEVGHLTIGAGRILTQPITQWFKAIEDASFFNNHTFKHCCQKIQETDGALHILGLLSDAGVHCHEKLIYATIQSAWMHGIKKIFIHPFLDGRDTPPQSAYHYLRNLNLVLKEYPHSVLGSLQGRFYAMDRDHNWDRTERSYRMLTTKSSIKHTGWEEIIEHMYAQGITDEFIPPIQLDPHSIIKNGDGIIMCNTRPDRARQLTATFVKKQFSNFTIKPLQLASFMTPVPYAATLTTDVLFPQPVITHTLKDQLAAAGKTIYTIAETEKYAHVTYFFRGENEKPVSTEVRAMIPSLGLQDYSNNPAMSAAGITKQVLKSVHTDPKDFYLINYANADMVGHSGNFGATIKAVECLDNQLAQLYQTFIEQLNGTLYITADHGKAENMYDEIAHEPRTAHTTSPVPFIMIQKKVCRSGIQLPLTQLADIAPFILHMMDVPVPIQMSSKG